MTDGWDEESANLFLIIYRFYIFKCHLRKKLPTNEDFERELKLEVKNIIISNPGNKELRDNLLPLWISNELTISEAIDILNTVDGKIETAKVLYDANKIVTLFSKPVINGYLTYLPAVFSENQLKHLHINRKPQIFMARLPSNPRKVTLLSKNNSENG